METYLPVINQYYSDWLAWVLINQINAGITAGVVFLTTAMLYSLRVGFLKRRIHINDKLYAAEKTNLLEQVSKTQQALKVIEDELVVNTEQMQQAQKTAETETERAKDHEALVNLRNEQISSLIQSLATRFDLGERPVPIMGDIKAEGLWQQHDRVTNLLATRLQSEQQAKAQLDQAYQVETLQRRELEALRDTLQTTLVSQQDQLSKLEQALEDQKSIAKIQQGRAEQAIAEALAQSQAELARIPLLEQQLQATSNNQQQSAQLQEALVAKDRLIAELEKKKVESVVEAKPQQQEVIEPAPTVVSVTNKVSENVSIPVEIKEDSSATPKESGLSSKFKGLFAKGPEKVVEVKVDLPESETVKPEVTSASLEIAQPKVVEQPVKEDRSLGLGKLKGMFGRGKAEVEPALVQAPVEKISEPVKAEVPVPVVEVKEPSSGFSGKFKGLLGKKTVESVEESASVEVTVPAVERKVEPEIALTPDVEIEPYEHAPEQNSIDFVKNDIAKTKAMISGLFGKKK